MKNENLSTSYRIINSSNFTSPFFSDQLEYGIGKPEEIQQPAVESQGLLSLPAEAGPENKHQQPITFFQYFARSFINKPGLAIPAFSP